MIPVSRPRIAVDKGKAYLCSVMQNEEVEYLWLILTM